MCYLRKSRKEMYSILCHLKMIMRSVVLVWETKPTEV